MDTAFLAGALKGEYIYYSDWMLNGLYRMSIETGECELLNIFLKEKNIGNLHNFAFLWDDTIWFIPSMAEHISYYDISENVISYLSLPKDGKVILDSNKRRTFRFFGYQQKGTSFCWLLPIGYNLFLKLDMEKRKLEKVTGRLSDLNWSDGIINYYGGCLFKNRIILCPYASRLETIVDLDRCIVQITGNNKYSGMYRYIIPWKEKLIYVPFSMSNPFIIYDTAEKSEQCIFVSGKVDLKTIYLTYAIIRDEVILYPYAGSRIIRIDLNDSKAYTYSLNLLDGEIFYFQRCIELSNGFLICSDRQQCLLKVDMHGKHSILNLTINECRYYDVWINLLINNNSELYFDEIKRDFYVEKNIKLSDYIKYLKNQSPIYYGEESEETTGREIYRLSMKK